MLSFGMQWVVFPLVVAELFSTNQVEDALHAAKIQPLIALVGCLLAGRPISALNHNSPKARGSLPSRSSNVFMQRFQATSQEQDSTARRALLAMPLISLPLALPTHADADDEPEADKSRWSRRLPPLERDDWWYKYGQTPTPEQALRAPFIPPQVDKLPYVLISRRVQGWNKYNIRVREAIRIFSGPLHDAVAEKQWKIAQQVVERPIKGREKNVPASPLRGAVVACVLFCNYIVQDENELQETEANLLLRYLVNELNYSLDDIDVAAKNSDAEAAAAAWSRGKRFFNAYISIVNLNVDSKFGDKFPLVKEVL